METEKREEPVEPEKQFEVGSFRSSDAKGIVQLFQAVYGDGYPIKVFYDEGALTEANAKGQYYSIVARTPSGRVIGVEHLYRSAPYQHLYEVGAGLVLKEWRVLNANNRMLHYVFEEWVPGQDNIEQLFGEPVCNHPHMQKAVLRFSHIETALEVALMPVEAYGKERSAAGRVAVLFATRCYKPKPHRVYLPPQYEKELQSIYSRLDDRRDFAASEESLPGNLASKAEMTVFDFARVARVALHETGHDFEEYVGNLEASALAQKVVVIQVWLKLSSPWCGSAVDILRNKGYFLGGVLPRWFDEDGLLMQKVLCEPDFEAIQLYTDHAKEIFAMVKEDWKRVRALGNQ